MLTIGLTGGIGSGKSTTADYFAEKGITIIDSDQIARDVVAPKTEGLTKIIEHFGTMILDTKGELNRRKLREIIFNNDSERKWLENLLHPLIRQRMQQQIAQAKSPYCIAVIPLLIETLPNPLIDRILVIDAPESEQLARTMHRDQAALEQIKNIIHSQAKREQRLAAANDILTNDKNLAHLKHQIDDLHLKYLELAKSHS